jgi:MFS family permease
VLATLVAAAVEPGRRGGAIGALTSSWDAGLAVAGPLGAAVVVVGGLRAPFLLAAAVVLVAAVPRVTSPSHSAL